MKQRQIIISVSIVIIFTLFGFGIMKFLFSKKPADPIQKKGNITKLVDVQKVKYISHDASIYGQGRLASSQIIDLVSEANGKIQQGTVALKEGQTFRKGDKLFTIYKDEAELALKARKSTFISALASVQPDIKIDFSNEFNEFSKFFQNISIDKNLPKLPNINNKLQIFLSSRNILTSYYQIKQAEKALIRHTVYAPFTGTFLTVNMQVGSFSNIGGRVAKIIRTDNLEMEVPIELQYRKYIRINDKVDLYANINNSKVIGTVVRKSNYIDESSQSRSVFIRVAQNKSNLLFGEYLKVAFPGKKFDNVMEIPRNAIFNNNEVFIVKDGFLETHQVNIHLYKTKSALINGIEEGELLVVQPLLNVKAKTEVKVKLIKKV